MRPNLWYSSNTSFPVCPCNSLISPLGGKGAEFLSFSKLLIASYLKGFSDSSVGKESTCNAGDPHWIPGLGKSWRRERLPTPVFWPGVFWHGQYSGMDCIAHGVAESDMTEWLSFLIATGGGAREQGWDLASLSLNAWGAVKEATGVARREPMFTDRLLWAKFHMKRLHTHISLIILAMQFTDEKTENQGGTMTCSKSRDITLLTKVCLVKAMAFSSSRVRMWQTIRKAECRRTDASELWCWRRLLRDHCSPRGCKELDMTWRLNKNNNNRAKTSGAQIWTKGCLDSKVQIVPERKV